MKEIIVETNIRGNKYSIKWNWDHSNWDVYKNDDILTYYTGFNPDPNHPPKEEHLRVWAEGYISGYTSSISRQ